MYIQLTSYMCLVHVSILVCLQLNHTGAADSTLSSMAQCAMDGLITASIIVLLMTCWTCVTAVLTATCLTHNVLLV